MSSVLQDLTDDMQQLPPDRVAMLEDLVHAAITQATDPKNSVPLTEWPPGFFEQTAGCFANEPFERPEQGPLPIREEW